MTLFPFKRPTVGLCIRAHAISVVELGPGWMTIGGGRRLRRVEERRLPPGLVRPFSSELNVTDVSKLVDEIQILLDRPGPTAAVLNLPDLCARTALFDFDALPAKPAEREALLRWRFQKDLNVAVDTARLVHLVFRSSQAGSTSRARVLAAAARRTIIEQYEQTCEKAGVIPVEVRLTGPALFDLCRPAIQRTLMDRAADGRANDEWFFSAITDDSFSLFAIRHGVPSFTRMKSRNGTNGAASLVPRASAADEVLATLHFYDESHGPLPGVTLRPVFVVAATDEPLLDDVTAQSLGVEVIPISWPAFRVSIGRSTGTPAASTLAAMAGVVAA
jgi:Tfp pilus assembly PilM family ATPase